MRDKYLLDFVRGIPDLFNRYDRVILLMVDALGTQHLNLPGFDRQTLETVFPSSTPTFFYSFHSLLDPGEHGFLDWFYPVDGEVVCIPPWMTIDGKEVDVGDDEVFPFVSLSERLSDRGISSLYLTPFPESRFTQLTGRGASIIGIGDLSDVLGILSERSGYQFNYIYWDKIDDILHREWKSDNYHQEVKKVEDVVREISRQLDGNTLFLVTADHGQTRVDPSKSIHLPVIDGTIPYGGSRVAFYRDLDMERVREVLGDGVKLFRLTEFYDRVSERALTKYGDVVVVAPEQHYFIYPFEQKTKKSIGMHGGLSDEERMVNLWKVEA